MDAPRFTLRQLEIFLAVGRTGNISKAAEELHCSPSAASSSITELERSLHTQLCVRRKSRGVELTAQGRLLTARASRLLADAASITDVVDEGNERIAGVLRLGCYAPLAASFLPPLLRAYTERHPLVTAELHEDAQDGLCAGLRAGDLAVALIYEAIDGRDLEFVHLLARRPYILMATGHPLAARDTVTLAELAHEPLIMLDLPPSKQYALTLFRESGVYPKIRWETKDIELVRALVAAGMGCALMLQRQHAPHALDGTPLRALEIEPPTRSVDVFLAMRADVDRPRRVHAFVDVSREVLADPPAWTGAVPVREGSPEQ